MQHSQLQRELGVKIRKLREQKGWSQEHFADRCGLHRTYIGSVERGERNLTLNTLLVISSTLEITMADLLFGLEESGRGRKATK